MLSKPILNINTENIKNEFIEKKQKSPKSDKEKSTTNLSYTEYIKDKNILTRYKLPQLKSIAKHLRLYITGAKPVLIERIESHFSKCTKTIIIQRSFRGFIVRKSFCLRGEAFKQRGICVNDTDFYTLEPLKDIEFELFFSYKDKQNFHYGFNITSLIQFMKNKTREISNPYNRESISNTTIKDMFSLYKKIHLLFPYILETDEIPVPNVPNVPIQRPIQQSLNRNTNIINYTNINQIQEVQNKITAIREKAIPLRINELFMEIDQLGNYTDSAWFSQLAVREYVRLYRTLYDIWNYRAQLSYDIKHKICIIGNPFINIFNERIYYNDVSLVRMQEACLVVFENLVYCGVDTEHRKIGTMHALSALTMVSINARNTMPWLYESLVF